MPARKQVDRTTKDVKPDFESGPGYYWMKQMRDIQEKGTPVKWPRKPRRTKAEQSFFKQVDTRLSRRNFTVSVSIDKTTGKLIREDV